MEIVIALLTPVSRRDRIVDLGQGVVCLWRDVRIDALVKELDFERGLRSAGKQTGIVSPAKTDHEHAARAVLRYLLEAPQRHLGDTRDEAFQYTVDERRSDVADSRVRLDEEK